MLERSMLELTREAYDDLIAHARAGAPAEVCGVLAGTYGDDHSVVTSVHRTENVADTPERRYRLDPEAQFAIIESIEDAGLDLVGFYHSHPAGSAHPSETDIEQATWPDVSYVICALDGEPFLGSWRWRDGESRFDQELVRLDCPDSTR